MGGRVLKPLSMTLPLSMAITMTMITTCLPDEAAEFSVR